MNIEKISKIINRGYANLSRNQFEKRILKRWRAFWIDSSDLERVNTKLKSSDPIEKWENIENWQRRLSNKNNAKEFASKMGCRVAKVYFQGGREDFLNFNLSDLPENYILKPVSSYSSRNVYLMHRGFNLFDKQNYSPPELGDKISNLFDEDPSTELIIEEFIPNENGEYVIPNDYRFWTFNGKIVFIQLDKRTGLKKDSVAFYTREWKLICKKITEDASTTLIDSPPIHLEKMIQDVERLSKAYKIFARIDFYSSLDGPVFGEFTPTPRKGKYITKYGSNELIKEWDKHCKGMI